MTSKDNSSANVIGLYEPHFQLFSQSILAEWTQVLSPIGMMK